MEIVGLVNRTGDWLALRLLFDHNLNPFNLTEEVTIPVPSSQLRGFYHISKKKLGVWPGQQQ
jgi:hypothetical protein